MALSGCTSPATADVMFIWEMSTPFGVPVVPLVYMTIATSEGLAGVASTGDPFPAASTSDSLDTAMFAFLSASAAFESAASSVSTMTCLTVVKLEATVLSTGDDAERSATVVK